MKKIIVVFGTRPEAIKMCPLVIELKKRKNLDVIVCVTGQHKEMLQQVLDVFRIIPDYNLEIMRVGQSLSDITTLIINKIQPVFEKENPDVVLVHGDTTTAFASALAAFYNRIPVAHVEAGLRTFCMEEPFPEEFNRQAVDLFAAYYFAPTNVAAQNLIKEGKLKERIYVTGNTGIDALAYTVSKDYQHEILDWVSDHEMILMTIHRRENMGNPMSDIFNGVRRFLHKHKNVRVVYPVHKNPKIREMVYRILGSEERVRLVEPLEVIDFHNFIRKSLFILTDSGGIQEEAPYFGKPVLVARNTTERPEGVEAGTLQLIGTNEESIYQHMESLYTDKELYTKMSKAVNPYGDGKASNHIADILAK